ncbi:hypothetical protein DFJ73DRAFT_757065 [Zopfochytrium polystomum]|nr:hypothetical protein DFJ73DRAFT_757065 [Zopfochytrium polystomum]
MPATPPPPPPLIALQATTTTTASTTTTSAPAERTIVIAVDASTHSACAFDWALRNVVRAATDEVVLVTVRDDDADDDDDDVDSVARPDAAAAAAAGDAKARRASHALLRAFAERLPQETYNVRGVVLRGDPREAIADEVAVLGADMLVVGSRGLGPVKRALLGSVSDYLVRHVEVPVLVARSESVFLY